MDRILGYEPYDPGSNPGVSIMASSSKWSGHRPFTPTMPGSNPAEVTLAPSSSGQDSRLSLWRHGFESRRSHCGHSIRASTADCGSANEGSNPSDHIF